jgi:hypothetical protein
MYGTEDGMRRMEKDGKGLPFLAYTQIQRQNSANMGKFPGTKLFPCAVNLV